MTLVPELLNSLSGVFKTFLPGHAPILEPLKGVVFGMLTILF